MSTSIEARQDYLAKRAFVVAMIAVTIIPMLVFLSFYRPYGHKDNGQIEDQMLWLVNFFAQGHVGLTFLMYLDHSFRPVIKENTMRFIYIPLFLVLILPFLLMTSNALLYPAAFIVIVWNIWHFNKQNIGICSLIAIAEGKAPPSSLERNLVSAACVLAICAHYPIQFPTYAFGTWLHPVLSWISNIVIYPYVAVVSFAIVLMWNNRAKHTPMTAMFYFLALTLFGMVFVARLLYPENPTVISMGYAGAHAAQYIIIMYLVAMAAGSAGKFVLDSEFNGGPQRHFGGMRAAAALITLLTHLIWGLYVMKGQAIFASINEFFGSDLPVKWLGAFGICVLFTHFILDGGAFKLSQRNQREWLRGRLPFIARR